MIPRSEKNSPPRGKTRNSGLSEDSDVPLRVAGNGLMRMATLRPIQLFPSELVSLEGWIEEDYPKDLSKLDLSRKRRL